MTEKTTLQSQQGKRILSLSDLRTRYRFKVYCVIGSSEDTMLLHAPYQGYDRRFHTILVTTPELEEICMYGRSTGSSIVEVFPFVTYPTVVSPGSILVLSNHVRAQTMITKLYKHGIMNDEIHEIMRGFGITDYKVPPVDEKVPCKLFNDEKWFDIQV